MLVLVLVLLASLAWPIRRSHHAAGPGQGLLVLRALWPVTLRGLWASWERCCPMAGKGRGRGTRGLAMRRGGACTGRSGKGKGSGAAAAAAALGHHGAAGAAAARAAAAAAAPVPLAAAWAARAHPTAMPLAAADQALAATSCLARPGQWGWRPWDGAAVEAATATTGTSRPAAGAALQRLGGTAAMIVTMTTTRTVLLPVLRLQLTGARARALAPDLVPTHGTAAVAAKVGRTLTCPLTGEEEGEAGAGTAAGGTGIAIGIGTAAPSPTTSCSERRRRWRRRHGTDTVVAIVVQATQAQMRRVVAMVVLTR